VFDEEAAKNKVLPLDPRVAERQHPNPPPPGRRTFYTFYQGATHLYDAVAPGTRNRTHTITAYLDIPPGGAEGVIVADGGLASGYALYLKDGRPTYTYNYFRREVTTIAAPERLPAGKAIVTLNFDYDGGGRGKGATVTLTVNGIQSGTARLAETVPVTYSYDETFDVGEDTSSPVGPYEGPFRFTGVIDRVELRAEPLGAPAKR
jgi:arylsulfatase